MIDSDQLVGDIIHVTDLFTTFARIGEATKYIPTDRVIDGIDQTELLLEGDTHGHRDYVHIYQGHTLAATVKGRYKRHWIGLGDGAASGLSPAYYDLYQDPHERNIFRGSLRLCVSVTNCLKKPIRTLKMLMVFPTLA